MTPGSVSCLSCRSTQTRVCAHVSGVNVYRCRICGLCFCYPLPTAESDSIRTTSPLTPESYTASILSLPPQRARRYETLADALHRFYSGKLGHNAYRLLEIGCGAAHLS